MGLAVLDRTTSVVEQIKPKFVGKSSFDLMAKFTEGPLTQLGPHVVRTRQNTRGCGFHSWGGSVLQGRYENVGERLIPVYTRPEWSRQQLDSPQGGGFS